MKRAFFAAAPLGLFLALVAGILSGSAAVPPDHVLGILAARMGLPVEPAWRPWEATVVVDLRLPRVLVGAFVGGGLALSGAALQGMFRNPLASPGVLGVTTGAALGSALAIYAGLAARSVWALPALAFAGAAITAFAVYTIASRRGYTPLGTLLLAGVAVGALNGALLSFVISLALPSYEVAQKMMHWLLGGLDGSTWDHLLVVGPVTLLGAAGILACSRDLDALLLGEEPAAATGVDVAAVRRFLILATSMVTGAAVAVSGSIGFVGLVIPHVVRLLLGPGHRALLSASLLAGAVFLVLCDLAARTLFGPEEMRLGVLTALLGAPFFLFLLLRHRREISI